MEEKKVSKTSTKTSVKAATTAKTTTIKPVDKADKSVEANVIKKPIVKETTELTPEQKRIKAKENLHKLLIGDVLAPNEKVEIRSTVFLSNFVFWAIIATVAMCSISIIRGLIVESHFVLFNFLLWLIFGLAIGAYYVFSLIKYQVFLTDKNLIIKNGKYTRVYALSQIKNVAFKKHFLTFIGPRAATFEFDIYDEFTKKDKTIFVFYNDFGMDIVEKLGGGRPLQEVRLERKTAIQAKREAFHAELKAKKSQLNKEINNANTEIAEEKQIKAEAKPVAKKATLKTDVAPVAKKATPKIDVAPVAKKTTPKTDVAPVAKKTAPKTADKK